MRIKRSVIAVLITLTMLPAPWSAHAWADTSQSSVAIRVDQIGGFVGPNFKNARLPDVVMYTNGRVLAHRNVSGSVMQMFEGFVNPSVVRSQVAAFLKATSTPSGGWGQPGVSDIPTTHILINHNGKKKIANIYALEFNTNNLPKATIAARMKLSKSILALIKLGGKSTVFKPSFYEVWPAWVIPDVVTTGSPNPAALFCQSRRGVLVPGKVMLDSQTPSPDLTVEFCHLPDGSFVEEWAYFYRASKAGIVWPDGVAAPTGACMKVSAKPFLSLMRAAAKKEWLLPSGQMVNLTWRPVLPGESACKR